MALAPHGDIAFDVAILEELEVGLGAIAAVGGEFLGQPAGHGLDRLDHRLQLPLIAAIVGQAMSDDHLMVGLRPRAWRPRPRPARCSLG